MQQQADELWARCEIWEISRQVCNHAIMMAPQTRLRTLDALHLATFFVARKRFTTIRLWTADARLREAAQLLGFRLADS